MLHTSANLNIVVLSPHIDDEVIGAGGSIAKHVSLGNRVSVLYLSSGRTDAEVKTREKEAHAVAEYLQFSNFDFLRLHRIENTQGVLRQVVSFMRKSNADIVYAPHGDDADAEHVTANLIASRSLWLANGKHYYPQTRGHCNIAGLLLYEIHRPLSAVDYLEDISPFAQTKRRAIELNKSQVAHVNYPDSALSLNRYRAVSAEFCDYAEAFKLSGFRNIFKRE